MKVGLFRIVVGGHCNSNTTFLYLYEVVNACLNTYSLLCYLHLFLHYFHELFRIYSLVIGIFDEVLFQTVFDLIVTRYFYRLARYHIRLKMGFVNLHLFFLARFSNIILLIIAFSFLL